MECNCKNCKHADKKKRYCYEWDYPRCGSADWCALFQPDTALNIIIRSIWWFNPQESKIKKSDRCPETYAGYREMQGIEEV